VVQATTRSSEGGAKSRFAFSISSASGCGRSPRGPLPAGLLPSVAERPTRRGTSSDRRSRAGWRRFAACGWTGPAHRTGQLRPDAPPRSNPAKARDPGVGTGHHPGRGTIQQGVRAARLELRSNRPADSRKASSGSFGSTSQRWWQSPSAMQALGETHHRAPKQPMTRPLHRASRAGAIICLRTAVWSCGR
jgi:hypothetical protein